MGKVINLEITPDEALVLFEYLSRFSNTGKLEFEDTAETIALQNLTCALERIMTEPFNPNYAQLLEAARERLRS